MDPRLNYSSREWESVCLTLIELNGSFGRSELLIYHRDMINNFKG